MTRADPPVVLLPFAQNQPVIRSRPSYFTVRLVEVVILPEAHRANLEITAHPQCPVLATWARFQLVARCGTAVAGVTRRVHARRIVRLGVIG